MFFIVLAVIILSGFFAAFKFPNLTARVLSPIRRKLPKINFGRWVSNPRLKMVLKDRAYFRQNVSQILDGPLFIVIGPEIYKLYDLLARPDSFGVKKNFATSDEAFDIIELNGAKFLFVHPDLLKKDKTVITSTRAELLFNRICKYRPQKYIDGIVVFPGSDTFRFSTAPPSESQVEMINFCSSTIKTFADTFKVQIPLYLLAHDFSAPENKQFKNIFKHDVDGQNDDLYLGFSCNMSKKPENQELYDFLKDSITKFNYAFDLKTSQIMQNSSDFFQGIDAVNAIHTVKTDIFFLSQNFISFLMNRMSSAGETPFNRLTILNSILFSSFGGSQPSEALTNCFRYLSQHGKGQTVISNRLLTSRRNINAFLSVFTVVFLASGVTALWKSNQYLVEKRRIYIEKSIANYQNFAELFNKRLANKFPFASSTQTQANADLNDLAEVLNQFKELEKGTQAYFYDHLVSLTNRPDIQKFIDDMKKVNLFFNIQKDNNGGLSYTVPVRFNFRVLRNEEKQARRIVNWTVTVGNDSYGSLYGDTADKTAFLWSYGNSLVFTLNLLEKKDPNYDKSLVPKLGVNAKPNEFVQGNAFIVQYASDDWSLFRFIEDYTNCSAQETSCSKGILQFNIPLMNQSNVVFFCEVALIGSDGYKEDIPSFPTSAPIFSKG